MQDFIEILRTNPYHAYEFIATHYHDFRKEELAEIIKELLYTSENQSMSIYSRKNYEFEELCEEVAENLEDFY